MKSREARSKFQFSHIRAVCQSVPRPVSQDSELHGDLSLGIAKSLHQSADDERYKSVKQRIE
jgi:hypothetical protein